ncbi:MAG: nucleoside triphosphate pyrophosphohydrolase [Hyphomonadaceae bacterium]|nr:nucleoside triphosphate pyrophosphohydrolase [Hyphomonadaceae bacterium]
MRMSENIQVFQLDGAADGRQLGAAINTLAHIMARLRNPDTGCPWDVAQSFATIAPYTIEEAYEVADAIQRGSMPALKEELGDLLFQVVFHARMAEEAGYFNLVHVIETLNAKMIERHPHVFGVGDARRSAEDQKVAWEAQKAEKRALNGAGVLDDVALALPALMRAEKLASRAARVGFDWPTADDVLRKLDEEMLELSAARTAGDAGNIAEEMGDILFVMANLSRKLGVDPEEALRQANAKFERRFGHVEREMNARGGQHTLEELEAYWTTAKNEERK